MTTTVIFADTGDGLIESQPSAISYPGSLSGNNAFVDTTSVQIDAIGQAFFSPTYYIMQSFFAFDTSVIGLLQMITDAVFAVYGQSNSTTRDYIMELAAFDWVSPLALPSWRRPEMLRELDVCATFDTTGFTTAGYNSFTSLPKIVDTIKRDGTTKYIAFSQRNRQMIAPLTGADEYTHIWYADQTGTTNDPKLTVTHQNAPPTYLGRQTNALWPIL